MEIISTESLLVLATGTLVAASGVIRGIQVGAEQGIGTGVSTALGTVIGQSFCIGIAGMTSVVFGGAYMGLSFLANEVKTAITGGIEAARLGESVSMIGKLPTILGLPAAFAAATALTMNAAGAAMNPTFLGIVGGIMVAESAVGDLSTSPLVRVATGGVMAALAAGILTAYPDPHRMLIDYFHPPQADQ